MKRTFYIDQNFIHFKFEYNPDIKELIKKIEGAHWNPELKEWYLERTLHNRPDISKIVKKYEFQNISAKRKKKNGKNAKLPVQKIKVPKSFKKSLKKLPLKLTPRKYQVKGIYYMVENEKVINGDDVGLGKTGQSICSIEFNKSFPCLVVPPASLKFQWEDEWNKWIDGRDISVIDGRDKNFDAEVIIINFDLLNKFKKELLSLDLKGLIVDESHFCKNPKSLRSKVLKEVGKGIRFKFLLTGTLIKNRPLEIVSQIGILGIFEELFGNFNKFVYRFCNARRTKYGLDTKGASKTLELNQILREYCYIRREKGEVKKELPPHQEIPLKVKITNKTIYKKAESDLIGYIRENIGEIEAENAQRAEAIVKINLLRQLTSKGKIKTVFEMVDNWIEETDYKICIFGTYVDTLEEISDYYKSPLIYGGTSPKKKRQIVKDFQDSEDRVIVGNIESMGTGTDGLQYCSSILLIIDLPDCPTDIDQVIGRLVREGQLDFVKAYMLISPKTIDARIWKVLQEKKKITDAVNKGIEINSFDKSFYGELIKSYT